MKASIMSSSREISVRGRTISGKCWKYALESALARLVGSLTTRTPLEAISWPKATPALLRHGSLSASSAGSLRSITTSKSAIGISCSTSGFWTSARWRSRERYVFAWPVRALTLSEPSGS